jgi:hypothetical protein
LEHESVEEPPEEQTEAWRHLSFYVPERIYAGVREVAIREYEGNVSMAARRLLAERLDDAPDTKAS